jgi:hypothetical protein
LERNPVNVLRVLSTELRQVFRAYTQQLKPTEEKEKDEKKSDGLHMRKGYEQVSLSEEAMKLSASEQKEKNETPENAS